MPTLLEHKRKYEHFHDFHCEPVVSGGKYDDWKTVGMFYEAVHILEAYFSLVNQHPLGHATREHLIKNDAVAKSVYASYEELYTSSCQARYEAWPITTNNVCAAQDALREISQRIIPLIQKSDKNKT